MKSLSILRDTETPQTSQHYGTEPVKVKPVFDIIELFSTETFSKKNVLELDYVSLLIFQNGCLNIVRFSDTFLKGEGQGNLSLTH